MMIMIIIMTMMIMMMMMRRRRLRMIIRIMRMMRMMRMMRTMMMMLMVRVRVMVRMMMVLTMVRMMMIMTIKRMRLRMRMIMVMMTMTMMLTMLELSPKAAIVNFYPVSGSLSPHTDHSEPNLSVPLLSISLGLPAIFLIGTASLDTVPAALLLKTGDVLVMEAEARLAYHAVPRIIKQNSGGGTSGDRVEGSF